jgi:hypothetical protein
MSRRFNNGFPAWLIPARRIVRSEHIMQDFLWILVVVGLLAATLAYVRLCDNA